MTRPTLQELGTRHLCERAWLHTYLPIYERILGHLRDQPIALLEIGIGIGLSTLAPDGGKLPDGAGLRMWLDFFPHAHVFAADILPWDGWRHERLSVVPACHQAEPRLAEYFQDGLLDVVIDDASHNADDQHATFRHLKPKLRKGAHYFIEDIKTIYELEAWKQVPEYDRHWANQQEGPGGKFREDDILVLLRG